MIKYRIVRGFVSWYGEERYWIEEKMLWWWRRVGYDMNGRQITFDSQQAAEDKINRWRKIDELERRGPVVVSEDP